MDEDYAKKLVVARLKAIPPNVSFSIGAYGDYTRNELIEQVLKGTEVGKKAVDRELKFLREMPRLAGKLHEFSEKTPSN